MKTKKNGRRIAGIAGFLVAASVFAWAWNSDPINLRDRIFPVHLYEVYPGQLYRSGQIAPNLIESTLKDLKIGLVVDLTHDLGDTDAGQRAEREALEHLGIERVQYPLGGSGDGRLEHYVGAVAAVARAEREGRPVLVHCRAGDRRSGGVIAAYQLLVRRESPERAFQELVRFARHPERDSRVLGYLNEHMGEIAAGLVEQGIIESVPDPVPQLALPPESSGPVVAAGGSGA